MGRCCRAPPQPAHRAGQAPGSCSALLGGWGPELAPLGLVPVLPVGAAPCPWGAPSLTSGASQGGLGPGSPSAAAPRPLSGHSAIATSSSSGMAGLDARPPSSSPTRDVLPRPPGFGSGRKLQQRKTRIARALNRSLSVGTRLRGPLRAKPGRSKAPLRVTLAEAAANPVSADGAVERWQRP